MSVTVIGAPGNGGSSSIGPTTPSTFTQGSVIFAGAGTLAEDNSSFKYDPTFHQLIFNATNTALHPNLTFLGDLTTGLYTINTGNISFAISGSSAANLSAANGFYVASNYSLGFSASTPDALAPDVLITRRAAATLNHGGPDAAAATAQIITFQGTRGGTDTNAAGANATIKGSLGTGTAASGTLIFQVGTPQASGSTQHVAATVLTLSNTGTAGTAAVQVLAGADGSATVPVYSRAANTNTGIYFSGGNQVSTSANGTLATTATSSNFKVEGSLTLQLNSQALTAGTMTYQQQTHVRKVLHRFDWTNAMVAALAGTADDMTVCTLPAKTVLTNAYAVITSAAGTVTTLTVAVGRVSATFIDYIVASDAKAAANTVYGDASAERGTNLTGYDLPSYTGTTAVKAHFISTGGNLSTVTTSTGSVYLETMIMP